ncbi:6872_t:CDS:2, partial [Funneliformis caledonium]
HVDERYVEIKNVDGTVDVTPGKYSWYKGDVVLEYVDHRPQPFCSGKRICLKQNRASLWDDVLKMNQDAGGTWTHEMAIQVESQLLLAMYPKIDLDPNSTFQSMKGYDPADGPVEEVHRELKTKKRKLNSYELEQEAAKKARKEQMMFMMDERHGKEFKPTFKLLSYFRRNGVTNVTSSIGNDLDINMAESGLSTSAKKLGQQFVRKLRFERNFTDENGKDGKQYKIYTLLNIYQDVNGKHEAICHSLSEKYLQAKGLNTVDDNVCNLELDDNRATFRTELEDAAAYEAFLKAFVVLYSIDNSLKFDSEEVDKVPVEMLTEVTTELTNKQMEMKFDNMQPYEIIKLLPHQSDGENITSSKEEAKSLSVSDLYNSAAKKKAMQEKPTASSSVNQDPKPPPRRNSKIGKISTKTQAQDPASAQSQNVVNQQMTSQTQNLQLQTQHHQATPSQHMDQQPTYSPVLQHNVPIQLPQTTSNGTHPVLQQNPISTIAPQNTVLQVPIQIQNNPNVFHLMQRPNHMGGRPNTQGLSNVRINIQQGINTTQVNSVANQQGALTQDANIRQGVRRRTTQDQSQIIPVQQMSNIPTQQMSIHSQQINITSQQMNISAQQMNNIPTQMIPTQQINIPTQPITQVHIPSQTSSSQMSQIQVTPQINIPTQPTDHLNRTSPLNIQSKMNQTNISAQVSDQITIQQAQTTPRINPVRVTPKLSQAQSKSQINIPAQVTDQVNISSVTPQINPVRGLQVNTTDQMIHQMSHTRVNPQMNLQIQSTDQNASAQGTTRINQQRSFQQIQLAPQNPNTPFLYRSQIAPRTHGRIINPGMINMQGMMPQQFIQGGGLLPNSFLIQNMANAQILQRRMRPQLILTRQMTNMPTQMIPQQQQMTMNQHLGMNGGQWIFQNQPPQNPQNPWGGNNA